MIPYPARQRDAVRAQRDPVSRPPCARLAVREAQAPLRAVVVGQDHRHHRLGPQRKLLAAVIVVQNVPDGQQLFVLHILHPSLFGKIISYSTASVNGYFCSKFFCLRA